MLTMVIFWGVAAVFLFMSLGALLHQRWARRLPPIQAAAVGGAARIGPSAQVRCSIVVAARDEQARIEQTIRHALAQRRVEIEVIIVDDRSTDKTSEILRKMTEEDGRVRVTRVDFL